MGSRVTTLDSVALAQHRGGTLADVLAARTPVYIKSYGPGQLASISFRGTAAQHTAVLWHGFNIGLPTLGQSDFALLPVVGITQVSVQHGPAGAIYGSGAVGGTVLLSSPVRWGAGLRMAAQAEAGSFGLGAGQAEGSFSNQQLALRTEVSYREARNDFAYPLPEGNRVVWRRNPNSALRQRSLAQDASLRVGTTGEVQAAVWLTHSERQLQPTIGANNDEARQYDRSRRFLLGYRHRASQRHESNVRAAWFEDVLDYGLGDTDASKSRVRTTQLQTDHTFTFKPHLSLRIGGEAQRFAAQVQGYGDAARITEHRFSGFGLLRYDPAPTLRLTLNVRQALLPGRRPPLTPTVGAEWQLARSARQVVVAKASVSRSYRAPTLNERYWRPGGRPDLLPENSLGYEAGLRQELTPIGQPRLSLQTELTAYHQLIHDWVQWTPGPGGIWSPRNLRQVRARGAEASTRLDWQAPGSRYSLATGLSYAFTQSVKLRGTTTDVDPVGQQLPYVPQHSAAFTTQHTWRGWQAGTTLTFTGFRFTDASATTFLPSYTLVNASAGYTLRKDQAWTLTLLAQGYNLTNLMYQSYAYRAMPLRSAALSLRVAWR
ncbi:TonB-dependent receptor plug domain-containing protein [Hymenobacter fastidiosus]|uniref:TonB-dependent receptor plug domain-containing protein n=1 Tax=Hymenobacter fastidiosus TaxID=486264 RepID=A0ABP7SQE0_9BACT